MNLVTGAARGLGFALHRALGDVPFTRGTTFESLKSGEPFDAIIHAAVNSTKDITDLEGYIEDNVLLTQRLLKVPHKRFVYISSVDVTKPTDSMGLYASTKLISETLVRQEGIKPLILRPTTLLGYGMRPNAIYRMLTESNPELFVAATSRYNLILHSDVCEFVRIALEREITGCFDLASSNEIVLGFAAKDLGLKPTFGLHHYQVGKTDNLAAARIVPAFSRTSFQTLMAFKAMLP